MAITLFDKVSDGSLLADIFHPFIKSSFYFLALPEAQMTNTKSASSLPIPLLLLSLSLSDGKYLNEDAFNAEVTNILVACRFDLSQQEKEHKHLSNSLTAVMALSHLLLESTYIPVAALLLC